jgi:hypothetical protein
MLKCETCGCDLRIHPLPPIKIFQDKPSNADDEPAAYGVQVSADDGETEFHYFCSEPHRKIYWECYIAPDYLELERA